MVVGQKCPDIDARRLTFVKGQPLKSLRQGEGSVLVLEFWSMACSPCLQSIPHLSELANKYRSKGVHIIGITTDHDIQKVERFAKSKVDMAYTVCVDKSGATEELLNRAQIGGIPHAFIVDGTNTIVYSGHPMDPGFELALQKASQKPQVTLPPVTQSVEELMKLSIKELKGMLTDRNISMAGAAEKADLASLLKEKAGQVTFYR